MCVQEADREEKMPFGGTGIILSEPKTEARGLTDHFLI